MSPASIIVQWQLTVHSSSPRNMVLVGFLLLARFRDYNIQDNMTQWLIYVVWMLYLPERRKSEIMLFRIVILTVCNSPPPSLVVEPPVCQPIVGSQSLARGRNTVMLLSYYITYTHIYHIFPIKTYNIYIIDIWVKCVKCEAR